MDDNRGMYRWRSMTSQEREVAFALRLRHRRPWHSVPHYVADSRHYMITAACFNHQPLIGTTPDRMAEFEVELLESTSGHSEQILVHVVLPNHYHILVHVLDLQGLLGQVGKLHGRTSHRWNGADGCRGRQVWHGAAETGMKSERHFWATLNYVLHNPVRHGYVEHWQDWPYSSAAQYLEDVGRAEAERRWREYPILDYGKDWDPPDL